jgi:hypothetical protein
MNMWREKFGDPDKAEQREREQRIEQAAKQKAAAPAEQVSGIHNTEEFIRKRLFR